MDEKNIAASPISGRDGEHGSHTSTPPITHRKDGSFSENENEAELRYCPECRKNVPVSQWMYDDDTAEETSSGPFLHVVGFSIVRLIGEFVMWILRSVYFREVTVVGKENIPQKGAAIFYGNHQNQFIDPLMMNSYIDRNLRFLMAAKSLKQPIIGTLGRMFESVPVIRPQDVPTTPGEGHIIRIEKTSVEGKDTKFTKCLKDGDVIIWRGENEKNSHRAQVQKVVDDCHLEVTIPVAPENVAPYPLSFSTSPRIDQGDMYAQVYETLKKSHCIGIFPEGGSHDHTSLLPLKAGVALFSLGAVESGVNVKIVPVGLTYLHGHKFRSRAYVQVGEPITPPPHLVQQFKTNRREAIASFLKILQESLKAVTINVADYPTLQFLHNFRQLYQPLNCFLPPRSYLHLIRRLAQIIEDQKDNEEFQTFRKSVEIYAAHRDNLYLNDSQVATLKYLSAEPKSKYLHLLIRRLFTLVVLISILLPFLVLGIPLGCCIEYFATKRTIKAVKESTVKIVGADVKGSFRIMMSFFFFPVGLIVATLCVYLVSNLYSATAVFISLPMAMYMSLLVSQEAQIELKAIRPLFLFLFSSYQARYKHLYSLRKGLVVNARRIVQECDFSLHEEMEQYRKRDEMQMQPSLFSIRHNIRRRHEFND